MKKLALFLLISIFQVNTYAKDVRPVPISSDLKIEHGNIITDGAGMAVMGIKNDNIYIGYGFGQKFSAFIVDGTGKVIKSNKIEIPPYQNLKRNYYGRVMTGNHIFIYTTVEDKKLDKYMFLVDEIDINTFSLVGQTQMLEEISYEKRKNKGNFQIFKSQDLSKILLYKRNPAEKGGKEKYDLIMFDSNMKQLWNEQIELPYLDSDLQLGTLLVDNDGNVFMSAKKWGDIKSRDLPKEERMKNHYYSAIIFMIKKSGKDIKEFELDIENKWLTDIAFSLADDGRIVGSGFYSEKSSYGIKGAFYVSIDKDARKITKYSLKEFSKDFLYATMSDKSKAKAEKKETKGKGSVALYNFRFNDLLVRKDGSVVMLAEQNYEVTVCTTDPKTGARTCRTTYYYNWIIAVNIDTKGEITWATWVPKKQISGNPYLFGYHAHPTKNKIYLLFNDNIKNFQLSSEELMKKTYIYNGKKGIPVLVTINADGSTKREALFVKDPTGFKFVPHNIRKINDEFSLMYGQKGKKERYSRLIFN